MEGKKDGAMHASRRETLICMFLVMVTVLGHPSPACLGIVVKVTPRRGTNNTIVGLGDRMCGPMSRVLLRTVRSHGAGSRRLALLECYAETVIK